MIDDLEADYVVVGSGAAGATAALVLSEAGYRVIVLEEGPPAPLEARTPALLPSLARLYRDAGLQVALGRPPVPILQGRCVGGTTVVNAGILWRFPEDVHAAWAKEDPSVARDLPLAEIERWTDRLEALLGARPVADAVTGENDRRMAAGAAALGIEGRVIRRNEAGCEGSGRCIQACPNGRKRSMEASFLPAAEAKGARILSGHRAIRIVVERGRAVGVLCDVTGGSELTGGSGASDRGRRGATGPRLVRARRAVLLAASAVGTPLLLRASGVTGLAGERFQCHPGVAVLGLYDEPVRAWAGATQAWESGAFRARRFKLEALGLPPELLAARLPGAGTSLGRGLDRLDRLACFAAQVRSDAVGSVRAGPFGGALIRYAPSARDAAAAADAVRVLAEIHFAAGARGVVPGVHGAPSLVRAGDLDRLAPGRLSRDPAAYSFVATHLFGTARMSADPARGVVRPLDLETHAVRGLHVVDSSVFPSNLGVNPQLAIMAVAAVAAERIAAKPAA